MKSKMKSAFALIAVALMIMVAVVPMISVFTSESQAAAVVSTDPSDAKDTYITLNVTARLATGGQSDYASGYVKITYLTGYSQIQQLNAQGATTFTIYEEAIPSINIDLTDKDGVKDADFSTVTLTGLSKGGVYSATLIAGHLVGTLSFKFADEQTVMTRTNLANKTVTANYAIYDGDTATSHTGVLTVSYASEAADAALQGTFTYPTGLANPKIAVTGFYGVDGVSFDNTAKFTIASNSNVNTATAVAKQVLITVTPSALSYGMNATVKVDEFRVYYTPAATTPQETSKTYTAIKSEMTFAVNGTVQSFTPAYFVGEVPTDLQPSTSMTYTLKVSANGGSMTEEKAAYTATGYAYTYVPHKAFYGKISMGDEGYTQAGTIGATVTKSATATDTFPITQVSVDADGYFFKFFDQTVESGYGAISNLTFGNYTLTTTSKFGDDLQLSISTTKAGAQGNGVADFGVVTGYIKLKNTNGDVAIVGKEITMTAGITIFGSVKTDANGKFAFYAQSGKSAVLSVTGATLTGKTSIVTGSDSDAGTLYMSTQKATVTLQDALGVAVPGVTIHLVTSATIETNVETVAGFTYSETKKVYEADVRGDVPLSSTFVYFTGGAQEYAADCFKDKVTYQTSAYKATTATYTVQLVDIKTGNPIYTDSDNQTVVAAYVASVYKNSAGAIIYQYDDQADKITLTKGGKYPSTSSAGNAYTFVADATMMAKSSQSVSSTASKYVIAVPGATATTGRIFDTQYILTSTDGYDVITSGLAFLAGKFTKLDGETPIAGATVDLYIDGDTTAEADATAVTQSDGSYYIVSYKNFIKPATNVNGTYIKFTATGYGFEAKSIYDTKKNIVTDYVPTSETYTITFVDADGASVDVSAAHPTITATKIVSGVEQADNATFVSAEGNVAKYTAAWTSATSPLSLTSLADTSFSKHTLTAEELSTGEITIVSNQSTYVFSSVDYDGKAIGGIKAVLYKYDGDQPVVISPEKSVTTNNDATSIYYGMAVIRLPLANDTVYTDYGFKADKNGTQYEFADEVVPIESAFVEMESIYGKITFALKDAAGEALEYPTGGSLKYVQAKVYKDDETTPINVTPAKQKIEIINDPTSSYTVSVTKVEAVDGQEAVKWTYTYADKLEPEDGVLVAKEEWIVGDVMDAAGISIGTATTVIEAYNKKATKIGTATYNNVAAGQGAYYEMLVDISEVSYFAIKAEGAPANYTFEKSALPVIYANEQTVYLSAFTANLVQITTATFTEIQAYDVTGAKIGAAKDSGTTFASDIVDIDDVAYFKATIGGADGYTFGTSETGIFVANESLVSGTLPFTGTAGVDQKLRMNLYLNDNLVGTVDPNKVAVNGYNYTAKIDLSGMVVDTAGIAFDSIVAVYSENGIVLAETPIDPFTQVNDIVSPIAQQFFAELVAPSAIIALHVDIAQVGNTATVTADGKFIVADDESIYTDGQYIYTFAGWYVDNEKVSANPVFTFTMTESVVISPQYTVTYEKISDVNKDVEKEYVNIVEKVEVPVEKTVGIDTNVLIIGICAVIVALIAVVYAVIKKD